MKKNYKNRAMRTEANEPIRQSSPTGKPENKIRIYLGPATSREGRADCKAHESLLRAAH
jgi:hypothetical protein